jgi:hypothetical protein
MIVKKVNKTARRSNAPKFGAARQVALAGVRNAAFNAGVSRSAVIAATRVALGAKPVLSLYTAGKLELQIGFMAAALARKGDNRPSDKLMEHCRSRLTEYQGFGGSAKLRAGSKGRRTKEEEEAYGSARVLVSAIMKEAGVKVPEARGGDTSKTRAARPAAKASKGKAGNAGNDNRPTVRTIKSPDALIEYLHIQAKAMQATFQRSSKASTDPRLSEAGDLLAAFVPKLLNVQ